MTRRLLNLLTALSLLLCAAVAASWASSYLRYHYVTATFPNGSLVGAKASRGLVGFSWGRRAIVPTGETNLSYGLRNADAILLADTFWRTRGFDSYVNQNHISTIVPHWAVFSVVAIPTLSVLAAQRSGRRRKGQAGLCPSCGYDLRATPGRCPECGMMAAAQSAA